MSVQLPTTGSFSLTDLTFPAGVMTGVGDINQARASFTLNRLPAGVTITVSNIVLRGDGITNTLSLPNVTLSSTSQTFTDFVALDVPLSTWQSSNSRLSFDIQINGGSLDLGTALTYRCAYRRVDQNGTQLSITTRAGNIPLRIAVVLPNTGTLSLTGLTFFSTGNTDKYANSKLAFQISSLPPGVTVTVSNMALSGDGIASTLSFPNLTLSSTSLTFTDSQPLDNITLDEDELPIAFSFSGTRSMLSFDIQINGGSLNPATTLIYYVQYLTAGLVPSSISPQGLVIISTAEASQNTFGLPADVVALITSRFGSVANFLRLKNQGYV